MLIMAAQDGSVPWIRRWYTWFVLCALTSAATFFLLAHSRPPDEDPHLAEIHVGSLRSRPDADFVHFLPTEADFSPGHPNILTLTSQEVREHPLPSLSIDPPFCDPLAPLRSPEILALLHTGTTPSGSYTIGVAREPSEHNILQDLSPWVNNCETSTLLYPHSPAQPTQRSVAVTQLPSPNVGADDVFVYSITVEDAHAQQDRRTAPTHRRPRSVSYPPQTHVMSVLRVRGVMVYCLDSDTRIVADAEERERILAATVERIRRF